MNYGKALRIARAIENLSQAELSRLAGVGQSYISLIENGKWKPRVSTIEKLTKALHIPNHLFTLLAMESGDEGFQSISSEDLRRLGGAMMRTLEACSQEEPMPWVSVSRRNALKEKV